MSIAWTIADFVERVLHPKEWAAHLEWERQYNRKLEEKEKKRKKRRQELTIIERAKNNFDDLNNKEREFFFRREASVAQQYVKALAYGAPMPSLNSLRPQLKEWLQGLSEDDAVDLAQSIDRGMNRMVDVIHGRRDLDGNALTGGRPVWQVARPDPGPNPFAFDRRKALEELEEMRRQYAAGLVPDEPQEESRYQPRFTRNRPTFN